jgi:hypothetical protein
MITGARLIQLWASGGGRNGLVNQFHPRLLFLSQCTTKAHKIGVA